MAKLTTKKLESLTREQIGVTVRDEGGLWGRVRKGRSSKGIAVTFYYRYKRNGRSRDICCGTWPPQSIATIRSARDSARLLAKKGVDPSDDRKLLKHDRAASTAARLQEIEQDKAAETTFEALFNDWIANGVNRRENNKELRRSFGRDMLPIVGKRRLAVISEDDIRWALKRLITRGVQRSAVVMFRDLRQMFAWALKRPMYRGVLVNGNPMDLVNIQQLVSQDYDFTNQRSRVLDDAEIADLHVKTLQPATAVAGRIAVPGKLSCAIWIMFSTLCRVGELSLARWDQVDFEKEEWFLPQSNVKNKTADHKVFLSPFALQQFKRLYELTGDSPWCFPSRSGESPMSTKALTKLVADRQACLTARGKSLARRTASVSSLVLCNGGRGSWTPHDLRRSGATIMQRLGVPLDVIDRCQNHVLPGSRVRRHYLLHDYASEKRAAWCGLGQHLFALTRSTSSIRAA